MKMLPKLIFMMLTLTIYYFSIFHITESSEEIENAEMQRFRAKLDPRLAKEYIAQEKKEAHKMGFEEGRIEKDKSIALEMLADGIRDEQIAKYTRLSVQQIQELKAH